MLQCWWATLIELVRGLSSPKFGTIHYYAKFGLPNKNSCNQRVGCLQLIKCACGPAKHSGSTLVSPPPPPP